MGFLARHVARLMGLRIVARARTQKPATEALVAVQCGSGRKPIAWTWNGHRTLARTKSEARGKFKQRFGLDRLPPGAVVEMAKGE